jgi:hypothetical protein
MAEASGEEKRAGRQNFPHQEMQQSKFEVGQSDLYIIQIDYTRSPRQIFKPTDLPFNNLMAVYLLSIQFYGCVTVFILSLDFPLFTLCLK